MADGDNRHHSDDSDNCDEFHSSFLSTKKARHGFHHGGLSSSTRSRCRHTIAVTDDLFIPESKTRTDTFVAATTVSRDQCEIDFAIACSEGGF
jgi:hypothetical protein